MLILGISGTPKHERSNTRFLLEKALEAAAQYFNQKGVENHQAEVLDLNQYDIRRCTGCDACVRKKPCPESSEDDMPKVEEKLLMADGIIISSPSYFTTVPGILKDFIDRSRPMKMNEHQLRDKVFAAISYAGLRYGGQEAVVDYLNRYALTQGMIVVGAVGNPVRDGFFATGSMQTDDGQWRSSAKDSLAIEVAEALGKRVAEAVLMVR